MVTLRIFDSLKPVIAAVNGAAVGFGATVTLAADIRLGSTRTRYGFVFARRGIVPDGCASWFLPRIVGISRAARWSYTGDLISGDELVSSGLIDELHAPEDLLPAALRLAGEIAASTAPVSVAVTRQLLWRTPTIRWRRTSPSPALCTVGCAAPTRPRASPRSWTSGRRPSRCASRRRCRTCSIRRLSP
jgi:enoyl-CoA hydratase/carnithine racemase